MPATEHTPKLLPLFFTLQWIVVLADMARRLFALRRSSTEPTWPVDAVVPSGAAAWGDIRWSARCPFTSRNLGVYKTRAAAEAAVWEATEQWHER